MGRPRKSNPLNLPPRVYWKHGQFWYEHKNPKRWEALGADVNAAKVRARGITAAAAPGDENTLSHWLDVFLEACAARVKVEDMALRTLADYTRDTEPLKAFFGHMAPAGVEPKHVADYLDTNLAIGRRVRANREKACLSACFTWLIRTGQGGVRSNPCIGVRRNKETKRERYVEDAEMKRDLAAAPVQVQALAELVYRTLQRPEDIIQWTHRNIVERDGRRILRNVQAKTGTTVDIEITPQIDAVLRKLKAGVNVTGFTLIHRRDGKPYTYDGLCAMLKRRQKGDSWGFYDLKGKGATDMWLSGTPLEMIQVLCGHESIKTTERYVKSRWRGVVVPNEVVRKV